MATVANPIKIGGHNVDIDYQQTGQNTVITLRPGPDFNGWNAENVATQLSEWSKTKSITNCNFGHSGNDVTGTFNGLQMSKVEGYQSDIQTYLDQHLKKPAGKAMGLGGSSNTS